MSTITYTIHTLHRGRLIQILLGALFVAGIATSLFDIDEIVKILVLLISLPLILFSSVKLSQQPSSWTISQDVIHIEKGRKVYNIPLQDLEYIKNHIRSGGNLIAIHEKKGKNGPLRFWRNKLFQSNDEFDTMVHSLKEIGIPVMIG